MSGAGDGSRSNASNGSSSNASDGERQMKLYLLPPPPLPRSPCCVARFLTGRGLVPFRAQQRYKNDPYMYEKMFNGDVNLNVAIPFSPISLGIIKKYDSTFAGQAVGTRHSHSAGGNTNAHNFSGGKFCDN